MSPHTNYYHLSPLASSIPVLSSSPFLSFFYYLLFLAIISSFILMFFLSFSRTLFSPYYSCFAESKKPRSALTVFHQMRKRRIAPNGYTYMGVLKALSHMRDGLSAVQVIGEMREKGVVPDKKHYAMAMFACVTSNQCGLAESIFAM